jgi:NADPH:quinone reductase-like Zn-dependent oxidoreductase
MLTVTVLRRFAGLQRMKAIVCRHYGPPEALRLEDVARPEIAADEVLIRVRAASVNPIDKLIRGRPYVVRTKTGWSRPKDTRVGRDLAGQVEAVGQNVTRFHPGDEVFGTAAGAFAEYASARENRLAHKPSDITFEQAAATPIAGLTALQCVRDRCRPRAGARILINGAGGGVGTFAVQIAKSFGADVTAVCSATNADLVQSMGADRVIDYALHDFTQDLRGYDAIVDCVGNRRLSECRRVLNPDGVHVVVGAPYLSDLLRTWVVSLTTKRVAVFMASIKTADLIALAELLERRTIAPAIGSRYPLSGVPEALRYVEGGHARGKVVITIDS